MFFTERLRKKTGCRAIVRVWIFNPVRVELDLAIVEVEDRGVQETTIGIRNIAFIHLWHQTSRVTALAGLYTPCPVFYSAELCFKQKPAPDESKQYLCENNTLLETVIAKILVVFLKKRDFGDDNP